MDHSVGEATTPVVPAYHDACVTALVPALLEGSAAQTWLPAKVLQARQILLLVLDGLGWLQLRDRAGVAPPLAGLAGGPITTVAPSTTSAALPSLSPGLPPAPGDCIDGPVAGRGYHRTARAGGAAPGTTH